MKRHKPKKYHPAPRFLFEGRSASGQEMVGCYRCGRYNGTLLKREGKYVCRDCWSEYLQFVGGEMKREVEADAGNHDPGTAG